MSLTFFVVAAAAFVVTFVVAAAVVVSLPLASCLAAFFGLLGTLPLRLLAITALFAFITPCGAA